MEDLLGIIIPLIAVAGWLFGLFKKDEDDHKPARRNKPTPQKVPTPSGEVRGEMKVPKETQHMPAESAPEAYYEKKQEQLEKLKSQIERKNQVQQAETEQAAHDAIKVERTPKASKKSLRNTQSLSVKRNLSKRGLAESVIMAEVLGPPKALNPYRGVRQNNKKTK